MNGNVCIYQKVSAEIIELISRGKLKSGDKAPSVNDIRKKYKISHITALRVLQELAKDNYLEFVMGKGYYVKNPSGTAGAKIKGVIGCITRTFRGTTIHDNYFNEINQGFQNQAMAKNFSVLYPACNLRFRPPEIVKNALPEIRDTVEKMKDTVDGFIFDERIPDDTISEITGRMNNPFVLLNRTSQLPIDTVSADNAGGGKKGAEIALKMGYGHFILYKGLGNNSNHNERFNGFLETLLENGISESNIEIVEGVHTQPYALTSEKTRKAIKRNCKEKKFIFALTDGTARMLCNILEEENIAPGKDIGVLGFDGMGYAKMKKPYITTIEINPDRIGATAADIMISKINNSHLDAPGNHTIEINLYMGETI